MRRFIALSVAVIACWAATILAGDRAALGVGDDAHSEANNAAAPPAEFDGGIDPAQPLTKDQAVKFAQAAWDARVAAAKQAFAEELAAKQIVDGDRVLKFDYRVIGERPANGRSLYISLHGGGNAPPEVNDSQWQNQKRLYSPEEGVYLAPRAPGDSWNLWHTPWVDALFAKLIERLIVVEGVDPNRVYLMGYSAGGDGVYQLAPRMADRFAAASMMAGHPGNASPRGLRNLPFSIHMGENDAAYGRNKTASEWGEQLAALQREDPQGYEHWVKIYAGKGHWMDREDAAAVPWMHKFTRDPLPKRIVWRQGNTPHVRFYWLAVDEDLAAPGEEIVAEVKDQTIELTSDMVKRVQVRFNDQLLDLDRPVKVVFNGETVFEGKVDRKCEVIERTLEERGDPTSVFCAEIVAEASSMSGK